MGSYTIEKNIYAGIRANLMLVSVPMCAAHLSQATSKNEGEIRVERAGRWLGILAGLVCTLGLELYWIDTGQGQPVLNLFLALFLGAGFALILWAILAFYLAPRFADPDTRGVREAVKIKSYSPGRDLLVLEFSNPDSARAFELANSQNSSQ